MASQDDACWAIEKRHDGRGSSWRKGRIHFLLLIDVDGQRWMGDGGGGFIQGPREAYWGMGKVFIACHLRNSCLPQTLLLLPAPVSILPLFHSIYTDLFPFYAIDRLLLVSRLNARHLFPNLGRKDRRQYSAIFHSSIVAAIIIYKYTKESTSPFPYKLGIKSPCSLEQVFNQQTVFLSQQISIN